MKKNIDFNGPFTALKKYKVKPKNDKKNEKMSIKPLIIGDISESDSAIFTRAMQDVTPLKSTSIRTFRPEHSSPTDNPGKDSHCKEDIEVLTELRNLVSGETPFDITATGEHVEGHVVPIDPHVMRKLKNGEFAVQSHLDLHGMDRQAARQSIERFITNAHAVGDRCLLIIHGRGLSSADGPVLKKSLMKWLTTGPLSHSVLAFCSAKPCDGGPGAIYVLLKKRPQRSHWQHTEG